MLFFQKKNSSNDTSVEGFADLIKIYFQATLAEKLGISNLAVLPDLRVFKQTLKISTINNKIGVAEKKVCKDLLKKTYEIPNNFFNEIDLSIKKNCRNLQQMQEYLYRFQNFTMDLLTLATAEMSWKARIPSFFKNTLKHATEQTISKLYEKTNWKDISVSHSSSLLRQQAKLLGFSKDWSSIYVFHLLLLAKKQKRQTKE